MRTAEAQVLIDDSFDSDPIAGGGWALQGNAAWVPPLQASEGCAAQGLDPNDAFGDGIDDCTLHPGEGYVLLTPGQLNQQGNIFRNQRELFDDFKITAVVELRDGTLANPADGLCIVIAGTASRPGLGGPGGGMGATGLGSGPTLILEFDTWGTNAGDANDPNHMQIAWSPTGFPLADSIPISPAPYQGLRTSIPQGTLPLNNRASPPAPPNRILAEVYVADGTVACYLTNTDRSFPRTRLFTTTIQGFTPFQGYLGVTASTGSASQNHILHSLRLEELPADFCVEPPGTIAREIFGRRDPRFACGDYRQGDVLDVELRISTLRAAGESCNAPSALTIRERIPEGWQPTTISDNGSYDSSERTITWNLSGGSVAAGGAVTYGVEASSSIFLSARWFGALGEGSSPVDFFPIDGVQFLLEDAQFTPCGGIRCWNVLGAFQRTGGAAPGESVLRLDYLTDGVVKESGFIWYPGASIDTAFGGDGVSGSAAAGILNGTAGRNPDGVPEVFPWNDPDGLILLGSDVFGGSPGDVMAYAQAYIVNTSPGFLEVYLGISSDDSIQVLLNGSEAWIHNVGRGGDYDCSPQDRSGPHILVPGENHLLVKVFQGIGGWDFALRFEDAFGNPVLQGLEVHKAPQGSCIVPPIEAARDLELPRTVSIEGRAVPTWMPGETYEIHLTITDVRPSSPGCPFPTQVEVREKVPPGWTPSFPTDDGVIAGDTITWTLTGGSIRVGKVLGYRVEAAGNPGDARFTGTVNDGSLPTPARISGQRLAHNPSGFTSLCFVQEWLVLGPYRQPFQIFASPDPDLMRLDYLTDGAGIEQETVEPRSGATVMTAYGPAGPARSTALEPTLNPDLNPGGTPTWYSWIDGDDTVDFSSVSRGDENQVLYHALTYIDVAADVTVDIGLASDDAVQVLLDGEEIWINSIARPAGAANTVQDIIPAAQTPGLSPLRAGRHRLLVKVFEGAGEHAFRLRFQDPFTGEGICEGISVCLDPDPLACGVAPPVEFLRGDVNTDGGVSMGDPVFLLDYVFLAGPAPACPEAGDANDDKSLNITDAIYLMQFLFGGGPKPPGDYEECDDATAPGCVYAPSPCGQSFVRLPEPTLRLEFDVPRLVEEGVTPVPVPASVVLRNTEPGDFKVRGWSLSIQSSPHPQCAITSPTVQGTLAAKVTDTPPGLFQNGFLKTAMIDGNRGVVSTVILALEEEILLPGEETPHTLLRFNLGGPFVQGDCTPCLLEFQDGLHGKGFQPVRNLFDSGTKDYRPFSRPAEVRFCSAVSSLEPAGGSAVLSLTASDPARVFKLEPRPDPGSVLVLTLEGGDPEDESALYARWGGLPSRTSFDHAADARGQASQRLVIPLARDDDCFVLVQGGVFHGDEIEAVLRAEKTTLAIERLSSDCGDAGCSGVFHVAVQGAGFDTDTSFSLERAPAAGVQTIDDLVVSGTRAEIAFDVGGEPAGAYDLVARKGEATARLERAVEVRERKIGPRLEVSLDAPANYREYQHYTMTLRYANTGDEEMLAPLFEIRGRAVPKEDADPAPRGTHLGVAEDTGLAKNQLPTFLVPPVNTRIAPGPLHVLGVHLSGVAGTLPAGASGEIPIVFWHQDPFSPIPLEGERLEFSVEVLDTEAAGALGWTGLIPPQNMPGWTALRASLVERYGSSYHEALSEIATRLIRRGDRPWRVLDLLEFAAREATSEVTGEPIAVIIGTALMSDKAPLEGRIVAAKQGGAVVACATTDAEGSFSLGPLANGAYELDLEGFVLPPAPPVTISGGEDVLGIVIEALGEDGLGFPCPQAGPGEDLFPSAPGIPPGRLEPAASAALKPSVSEDPNSKEGPQEDLVAPGQRIQYIINFENNEGVTAAANRIVILDPLPAGLDASTVDLEYYKVGEHPLIHVSSGGGSDRQGGYADGTNSNRLDAETQQEVDVNYPPEAVLDGPLQLLILSYAVVVRNMDDLMEVTWRLCGHRVDPECRAGDTRAVCLCTIQPELETIAVGLPEQPCVVWILEGKDRLNPTHPVKTEYHPDAGILPPNTSSGRGQGKVGFSVRMSLDAMEVDVVNRACIVFDNHAPDDTNVHPTTPVGLRFRRGDATYDGVVDIADAVTILNCLFTDTEMCPPCDVSTDADDSEVVDLSDAVYILNFLFLGGDEPPDPGPFDCGVDPTIEDPAGQDIYLGCESYTPACREVE